MRGNSGNRPARRSAAALAGVVITAVLAAGCGIRTTSVPVDAGAAPSRVPCSMSAEDVSTQALQGIPVQIYLVCASQLVTVDRTVRVDETKSDRLRIAKALLDELEQKPPSDERRAGFSTAVPADLRVSGALSGDQEGTLRLSEQPEDLPSEALAQIVCTYAESESLSSKGTVVLAGPGNYAPRGYLCTSETKTSPKAAPTPGASTGA
ncbi:MULTISPECIES: GerMN domain-containing protein [unclassified Streptomyces]|uniref:GerMN domain-containing protein n=1 Tax=unclassified Streptomyces TaxID=2593676 RepID=UPI0036E0C0A5